MKLSLVLFVLFLKMRKAARKNELFSSRLQARTGSILIRTADYSAGRLFLFGRGHIFSKAECHGNADVRMIWKNADIAFKAMTDKDPQAVTRAIDSGDLCVEGDMSVAQWFNLLVKALKSDGESSGKKPVERVAVIGLGKMGSGLAWNIQNAGYDLVVYNRTPAKAHPFVEKGAILAGSPAEAAGMADIVITCLMDDSSVRKIVTENNGILSGMAEGGIHLCATTISPGLAVELTGLHKRHGSHFVTGAVVGRPDAAKAGELLTLMGGEMESIEKCRAVCSTYSAATLVIGAEPELANYAKLSANYFAVANMELMGQLYLYGDATGIGRTFYAQLFEASYANPILKFYAQRILDGEFETNVGFELSGGLKDLNLMIAASDKTSGSLNYAPVIISKMEQAIAMGWDKHDWSVFTKISETDKVNR